MPDIQVSYSRFQDLRNDSLSDGIKSLINDGKLNKINLNFDSYYANQEIMDTRGGSRVALSWMLQQP